MFLVCFFFFKQKTAYELRISDWSSDVCSSDLPPPYFPLDPEALTEHLVAAAAACAPLPFFIYVFTKRSGYPLPTQVIRRVAERADNLVGLKVSESSSDARRVGKEGVSS